MIFELGSFTLQDKIELKQKLSEAEVWRIIYDVSESLEWIYQESYVHLNIKPGNIVKCRHKYKLSDPHTTIEIMKAELQQLKTKA
jgi:serine/threonine protein kinase